MDREQHQEQVEAFFERPQPTLTGDLDEALYVVSELGLWPDGVDSVGREQAIECWKIIEKLRTHQFPPELRM